MKLIHKLHFWWFTKAVPAYWRAKAWLLWLPFRKLRAGLFEEFRCWGTPLNTLKAMSARLERTEKALKRAWAGWDKEQKRANHAELMLAKDRVSQSTRRIITDALGVDLDENKN